MLTGISWSDYFIGLLVVLILYYSTLYLLYQKKDSAGHQQHIIKGESNAFEPSNDANLIETIEALIVQASKNQSSLQELFFALQQLLKNSSDVDASFKSNIENTIQSNMQALGMSGFAEVELARLWKP